MKSLDKRIVVAVDFDNTLVNTDKRILEFLGNYFNVPVKIDRPTFNFRSAFPADFDFKGIDSLGHLVWNVLAAEIFKPNCVSLCEGAVDFLTSLERNPKISHVVLATSNPLPQYVIDTLKHYELYSFFSSVIFFQDNPKLGLSADILVDDYPHQLTQDDFQGTIIVPAKSYNTHWSVQSEGFTRVNTLHSIAYLISGLSRGEIDEHGHVKG